MNKIQALFTSNPLHSNIKEELKSIIQKSFELFIRNYCQFTIRYTIDNKENSINQKKKLEKKEKEKAQKKKNLEKRYEEETNIIVSNEYPSIESEIKTKYPRKPNNVPFVKILVEINRYEIKDVDTEPYAVYILHSYYLFHEASTIKRFKDFQVLYNNIKSLLPSNITLPEPYSKWGARNLEPSFLEQRKEMLSVFINKVVSLDMARDNREILNFIGQLPSVDPIGDQIFEKAMKKNKKRPENLEMFGL